MARRMSSAFDKISSGVNDSRGVGSGFGLCDGFGEADGDADAVGLVVAWGFAKVAAVVLTSGDMKMAKVMKNVAMVAGTRWLILNYLFDRSLWVARFQEAIA